MKSTGIVRKPDHLGRIVIPKEIRKKFSLAENDSVEIFIDGENIIFKKYQAQGACIVTGEVLDSNVEYVPGLTLSPNGVSQLLELIANRKTKTS